MKISASSASTATASLAAFALPNAINIFLTLTFVILAALRIFGGLLCLNLDIASAVSAMHRPLSNLDEPTFS